MTILALDKLWINLVATGEGISGASQPAKTQTFAIEGEMIRGASGRVRGRSVAGETGEFPYEYVVGTAAVRDKLRGWQGSLVQVRDNRGQKWYGLFFGVEVTEYKGRLDLYRIGFTLQMATYTEGT